MDAHPHPHATHTTTNDGNTDNQRRHTHAHPHAHPHAHTHTHAHPHMDTPTHTHTYTHTHTCTHAHTGNILDLAGWTGTQAPNSTGVDWGNVTQVCGRTVETGCLYNVFEDPTEHNNIISNNQAIWTSLLARVDEVQKGKANPSCCPLRPRTPPFPE